MEVFWSPKVWRPCFRNVSNSLFLSAFIYLLFFLGVQEAYKHILVQTFVS